MNTSKGLKFVMPRVGVVVAKFCHQNFQIILRNNYLQKEINIVFNPKDGYVKKGSMGSILSSSNHTQPPVKYEFQQISPSKGNTQIRSYQSPQQLLKTFNIIMHTLIG